MISIFGFTGNKRRYDPVTASIIIGGLVVGASASQAHQQSKAMKTASDVANKQQEALLKEAKDKSAAQDATNASAIARARQKALAAAVGATGRASTIKTGASGVVGDVGGTTKTLIGE